MNIQTHEAGRTDAGAGRRADDTVVAILTPPGRGAIAVVGLAGTGACRLADRRFRPRGGVPLAARPDASLCVGGWQSAADWAAEEVVVVRRSDRQLEVHCHGGVAACEAIVTSLVALGATRLPWADWLEATGADEIEVEARRALTVAGGPRASGILARQAAGQLAGELTRLAGLPPAERAPDIARLLAAARVGLRLTDPWRIVLAGPVNAGKSSLLNALAGHARCLVSPEPGTTRDLVAVRLVLGGWEVELVDAAGERPAHAAVPATERAGLERAAAARACADLVLRVVPADAAAGRAPLPPPGELVVVTKTDLATPPPWPRAVATSAATGRGIAELAAAIVARLVPEETAAPDLLAGPVPFTPRQVAVIRGLAD